MFSFDGQFKSRRVVSLGGAGKKVSLSWFVFYRKTRKLIQFLGHSKLSDWINLFVGCFLSSDTVFWHTDSALLCSEIQTTGLCSNLLLSNLGIQSMEINDWKTNQSINRYQLTKLVHWYRLVLVNRWSIYNHTKIVHQMLSIGTATSNRRYACYLSNHSSFLGSPGDEIGKTIPTWASQ